MRSAAVLAILLAASPSYAGRFTFGVSVARRDDRTNRSPGVFGELRLLHRLSLRVEMSHDAETYVPDGGGSKTQRLSGAVLYDLGSGSGRFTPFALAGVGTEKTVDNYSTGEYRSAELGAGIAATIAGDLVITLDARAGILHTYAYATPILYNSGGGAALWGGGYPPDSHYTSLRVGVGVRF